MAEGEKEKRDPKAWSLKNIRLVPNLPSWKWLTGIEDWFHGGGLLEGLDFLLDSEFPRLDISQTDTEIRVTVEVPGFKAENLKVEIQGHILVVSGQIERATEEKEGKREFIVSERHTQSFLRSVPLPTTADLSQDPRASLKDGVLTITLLKASPKQETKTNIKIEVE